MKILKQLVTIGNYTCQVVLEQYHTSNNLSITLMDIQDFEPYAVASVNIDGLNRDEIAIKNYSENSGILNVLIDANIIDRPHRYIDNGYINFPIVKLKNQ
jgi:hypothetical protein